MLEGETTNVRYVAFRGNAKTWMFICFYIMQAGRSFAVPFNDKFQFNSIAVCGAAYKDKKVISQELDKLSCALLDFGIFQMKLQSCIAWNRLERGTLSNI